MLKEIILGALTTVIGGLALVFFQDLANTYPVLATIGVVLTVLMVVVIVAFKRNVLLMLQPVGDELDIKGTWKTVWSYDKAGQTVTVHDTVDLKQIGRFVWGTGVSTSIEGPAPGTHFRHDLRGGLNSQRVFSGEWKNIDPGRSYYGHFQLKVKRGGKHMEGKWIGISEDQPRAGNWDWQKL